MFILASSVCRSLQCLIFTLTQGGRGGHLLRLTCSVVLWGSRSTENKHPWRVWGELAVSGPHWVCPRSRRVRFPGLHCSQAPGCSAGELSKAGPGFCALARSQPLRLRFSGVPRRHRLGWAFHAQVRAAQISKCLASALSQVDCILVTFPVPDAHFPGCATRAPTQVRCVSPLGS